MKPVRIALLAALAALALATCAWASPQRHVLPNGLTLITQENHEAPVATFQIWVRAGSALERPGEFGITHLIEHMIFKGTPKNPAGIMAKRIEALGGEVNAYTTLDHTNYFVTAASRYWPEVFSLLADAVANASFDSIELKKEKEVVAEEIRMNQDNPARRGNWALMAQAFGKDHPYGRPVIGSLESVAALDRAKILEYRKRWYRAPNMLVVAVGDFSTAKLLAQAKEILSGLDSHPAPEFKLPLVKVPAQPRLLILREPVRQATVTLCWNIPGLPSPQVYPLDMAAAVAGQGETSRLYAQIKEKKGLVDSIGASAYTPHGAGLFEVQAQTAPEHANKAWPAMLAQTLELIAQPPRGPELKRARTALSADFIRSRQTTSGQARMLGYFEFFHGGYEKMADYLARFKAVDAAQVAQALASNFSLANLSMVIQLPQGAPAPDQAQLQKTTQKMLAQLQPPAPAVEKATRQVLPNGMVLVLKPRRSVPLVTFNLGAPGGQAGEKPGEAGLYHLWAGALTRGSAHHSYQQLVTELEDMAANLQGFSGKSTCGLAGSFLASDWARGLELLAEVWQAPNFPPDQVAKAREEQLAALRAQQNSPVSRAFKGFRRLVYGEHPYGQDPLGDPATLAKMDSALLRQAHQRVVGPKGLVLSVVGDFDPQAVRAKIVGLWGLAKGAVTAPSAPPLSANLPARDRQMKDPQAKQTQIVLGYVAPSATDPRRHAVTLLEAMLGGQGGRLFTDLRDQRSLAYAVQPFYSTSHLGGVFGVYMGVGVGKEKEALDGLARNLSQVRQKASPAQELERAKHYVLGSLAISRQAYGTQAATMTADELLGLGFDYQDRLPGELLAVTAQQVQEVAAALLDPKHEALLTLGK